MNCFYIILHYKSENENIKILRSAKPDSVFFIAWGIYGKAKCFLKKLYTFCEKTNIIIERMWKPVILLMSTGFLRTECNHEQYPHVSGRNV